MTNPSLTTHQASVRDLLVLGLTSKEIALKLSRTLGSTEKIVSVILRKYNCQSRYEVIAKHHGLR